MNREDISVLIVDDSALMRNLIGRIIDSAEGLTLAGKAMNGVFALQKIPKLNPDVIVLDIEMPEMNGIEFLKERKKQGIAIPVVILSSVAQKGAKITMEALSLGASDFITKPSGSISTDIHTVGEQLVELLRGLGAKYRKSGKKPEKTETPEGIVRRPTPPPPKPAYKPTPVKKIDLTPVRQTGAIELIAIGISTGGPNALREVFSNISADIRQPIVIVQHMPQGFTYEFAKSLDRICPLEVKEAEDGDILKAGRVLIAPGNQHIIVEKKSLASVVRLLDTGHVNGHRPSVDVLFESVSRNYKNHALAVIMTGMGRDGARQIGSIYREGGYTIAQDEKSSIVFGMPRVAIESGAITKVVPLKEMAGVISETAKKFG
ncbi:MAG: chemotaxis response regulator protein-glutamate methylesterase [Spirochaetia bacterium]